MRASSIAEPQSIVLARLWRFALTLAGVCLAALASRSFAQGMLVAPVWIADAVTLAAVLKASSGQRAETLTAGFLGAVAANFLTGVDPVLSASLPAFNAAGVALCAALILTRIDGPIDLMRRRDLVLFVVGSMAAALVSAGAAGAVLALVKNEAPLFSLRIWAMADAVGLIMVTPILLLLGDVRAQLLSRRITPARLTPLAILAVITFLCCWQTRFPLMFLILPMWAYAAAELEFVGLAAGAVIVGGISTGLTAVGRGPVVMPEGDPLDQILVMQVFVAFSTLAMLEFTAGVIHRRRMTQSLEVLNREAEQRRAGAVEAHRRAQMAESIAGLGYWRVDLKTGVVDWSPQIYALFGLPRGTPTQSGGLAKLIHPEDRDEAEAAFKRICTTGEPEHAEARVITPNGEVRVIRSWSTAEFDTSGKVSAVMYVLMNVTEQRRVEAELRKARDAAEQAAVVKAEFLANMSHELRTPLTNILGFTALASAEDDMPDTVRRYIERVTNASKALLTLVNDVLDFSKLEAGEIRLEPRPVDMPQLAREVMDLFGQQAAAKGVALALDLADGIPPAVALDADRVRQVLINLVGNAVKFTAEGEVTLELGYDPDAGLLSAAVTDTGPGIEADRRSQLFQRFSQVDGSSTRTFGGTGLGLAICKGLVEAMGGEIGVETEAGKGSRFWFEVPTPAVDAVEAASASASVAALSLGNRFLVVDDNPANRALVRAILTTLGADIVEASDGYEGVKAAMELPFDVILMDMRMPGLSGEEAVAEIRRGGPNAACPIIAFSASADPHQLAELRRLGFDGCLGKPFTLTDLIRAVETAMAVNAEQEELSHYG
ncbi:MAG: ATP-binding protein [Caulobacteraceae bacterium]